MINAAKEVQQKNGKDLHCSTVELFREFAAKWEGHEEKFEAVAEKVGDLHMLAKALEKNTSFLVHLPEIKSDLSSLKESTDSTQRELIQALTDKKKSELYVQLGSMVFLALIVVVLLLKDSEKDLSVSPGHFKFETHDKN